MKIKSIGSNQTEITKEDGECILISYSTPVAYYDGLGYYKTSQKHSATTSKHIKIWLQGAPAIEKPQSFFDNLI